MQISSILLNVADFTLYYIKQIFLWNVFCYCLVVLQLHHPEVFLLRSLSVPLILMQIQIQLVIVFHGFYYQTVFLVQISKKKKKYLREEICLWNFISKKKFYISYKNSIIILKFIQSNLPLGHVSCKKNLALIGLLDTYK